MTGTQYFYLKYSETVIPVVFKPLLICCCFCTGLDYIKLHSAHLKKILPHITTLRLFMMNVGCFISSDVVVAH